MQHARPALCPISTTSTPLSCRLTHLTSYQLIEYVYLSAKFSPAGKIPGEPQERMEIRELAKDKVLTTLFLQAMKIYQGRDNRDPSSYFQASGIHGLPYEPFNGVKNPDFQWGSTNNAFGGYCHHRTQLFPSWHRPYLMMVEKVRTHASYLNLRLDLLHPPNAQLV